MRTRNIYILSAFIAATLSCSQFQEENIEITDVETVEMEFSATICDETDPETKTILDGKLGDELRKVLWTPEDAIAVVDSVGSQGKIYKLVNTNNVNSESTTFKGGVPIAEKYFAFYPYAEEDTLLWRGPDYAEPYSFVFTIPETQKYFPGSFATDSAPMIAKAKYGEPFEFKNLCGLLALNLTGSEKIRSITFSGTDEHGSSMYVSGQFLVHLGHQSDLSLVPAINYSYNNWKTSKSVTLVCDEPVQLSESEGTPFYFVLPPATYNRFFITITTSNGKIMMKEGTKPLTIKRSDVQPTANLAYVETVSINLSENGVANCYIVPSAGIYSFQADVIGNGDFGLISDAGFHTDDTSILPDTAQLLWCDSEGAIQGVGYNPENKRISFMATGAEGNAVIVAKDADENILWSWHIWMTDQPVEHRYVNSTGEYVVLDRNLGATRADRGTGEEWREAQGLAYQWGRKDPFTKYRLGQNVPVDSELSYAFGTSEEQVSIDQTVKNPKTFYGVTHSFWTDESINCSSLWTPAQKTIYDPCPTGYKVIDNNAWRSFSKNGETYADYSNLNKSGRFNNGWDFIYDGSNTTYYPTGGYIHMDGNVQDDTGRIYYWSSQNHNMTSSYELDFYYYSENSSGLWTSSTTDMTNGYRVRCMKDSASPTFYMDVTAVENVTTSSAKVKGKVVSYGGEDIKETGFVYGTVANVTHPTGYVISTGTRTGNIEGELNNLTINTKYYVKSFITTVNDRTLYSEAVSFITPNEAGLIDLSHSGSANCYIVYPEKKTYSIDLVKGNSSESIGSARTASILWETRNVSETLASNSIIESAEIDGNTLKFTVAENAYEGNALIAAKDVNGNILWSWHIWVVDLDPSVTHNKYNSGVIMMDRNLGATEAKPSNINGDYSAYGLYYQWGRKDPFPYLGTVVPDGAIKSYNYSETYDSIEYATQHPTEVYSDVTWNSDGNTWSSSKTIYDPCPDGWKVPDTDAWDDWNGRNFEIHMGYKVVGPTYSTPETYYPHADRIEGTTTWSGFDNGFWWTNNRGSCLYTHSSWNTFEIQTWNVSTRMSVRCMKDE